MTSPTKHFSSLNVISTARLLTAFDGIVLGLFLLVLVMTKIYVYGEDLIEAVKRMNQLMRKREIGSRSNNKILRGRVMCNNGFQ